MFTCGESDLRPLNIDLSSAWRMAANQDAREEFSMKEEEN